jgi:AbrB family looped-hinge helix DNA binding protein
MVSKGEVATITSKSMVKIPSRLRRKYNLRQGTRVEFVEIDEGLFLVPVKMLRELRGTAKEKSNLLIEAVRELEKEHREEAKRGTRKALITSRGTDW